MKPFRFGLQASKATDAKAWRALAKKTESLGYSTLFMPDHLDDQFAPVPALAVAAEVTKDLRVGSLVFGNDYRHPLVLAKEIATLDVLTAGRLEAGIGAGWMRSDYDQAGMAYDEPKVRVDRFAEAVEIMKKLWQAAGAGVDFDGAHYHLSGAHGLPAPHTKPHPRLLIGGGAKRILSIAARNADIVGFNASLAAGAIGPDMVDSTRAERFDERVGWVRAAAGDRFDDIELQAITFFVQIGDNGQEMRANLAGTFGVGEDDIAQTPMALIGSTGEIIEKIRRSRERWGFSYWIVHEPEMEVFAEIVGELDGT